jgi:hypothetical protein
LSQRTQQTHSCATSPLRICPWMTVQPTGQTVELTWMGIGNRHGSRPLSSRKRSWIRAAHRQRLALRHRALAVGHPPQVTVPRPARYVIRIQRAPCRKGYDSRTRVLCRNVSRSNCTHVYQEGVAYLTCLALVLFVAGSLSVQCGDSRLIGHQSDLPAHRWLSSASQHGIPALGPAWVV